MLKTANTTSAKTNQQERLATYSFIFKARKQQIDTDGDEKGTVEVRSITEQNDIGAKTERYDDGINRVEVMFGDKEHKQKSSSHE